MTFCGGIFVVLCSVFYIVVSSDIRLFVKENF